MDFAALIEAKHSKSSVTHAERERGQLKQLQKYKSLALLVCSVWSKFHFTFVHPEEEEGKAIAKAYQDCHPCYIQKSPVTTITINNREVKPI